MYNFVADVGNFTMLGISILLWWLLAWMIATTVRRVLNIRLGWPRTILIAAALMWSLDAMIPWLLDISGVGPDGPGSPQELAGFMLFWGMMFLWAFALGALILVALEVIIPTGSLPTFRDVFFGWGRRWRRFRRYLKIMRIFTRRGLASQIRGIRTPSDGGRDMARSLRLALDECGITFIKAGQMLSTRGDIIPPVYVDELSKLQTTAQPVPWEDIRGSIETTLGQPISAVFSAFDETPLASASGAQVHLATTKEGKDVVVKVQRPTAARTAELDLDIMIGLCRTIENNAEWARKMGLVELGEGFADSIREELDYREEVDNMAAMRASLDKRGVRIPRVEAELSSSRLVVMEKFDGKPVSKAAVEIAAMSESQRKKSASTLLQAVLNQIINDGIFHADLHPGNVFIWPDGSVGLLDFGSVGRIDATSRRALTRLLWSIDADDPVLATDSLLSIVDAPADIDERLLTREVGALLTKFRGGFGTGTGSVEVFTQLFELMVDHGLGIPNSLATALRSLGALEGTLKLIDPSLDLVTAARAAGRDAVGKITPEKIKDTLLGQAMNVMPLVEHLPHRINRITEDLESGNFRAKISVLNDPTDREFVDSLVQQIVTAILAVGAVLGGIILVVTPGGPELLPEVSLFTLLGGMLGFAGFVLALRSVAQVFTKGRRR